MLFGQVLHQAPVDIEIGGEQFLRRRAVNGLSSGVEQFGRRDDVALGEILVAARFRLPVPELLVFDFDRRKLRDALEAEDRMAEVGDRGVPVLEVEAVEKLR